MGKTPLQEFSRKLLLYTPKKFNVTALFSHKII